MKQEKTDFLSDNFEFYIEISDKVGEKLIYLIKTIGNLILKGNDIRIVVYKKKKELSYIDLQSCDGDKY